MTSYWIMETVLRILYAAYPVATYVPQFYQSSEGFSSATCLVVLILSVLRVAFWVCRRVREWSYLVYSITQTLMQFFLLDALIQKRGRRRSTRRLLKALLRGERSKLLPFWAWDDLPPYVEVVVVVSLLVAAVSAAALRLGVRDAYSEFLGTCVACVDALVGVPQLRTNCVRRDSRGVSTMMVVAWLIRDLILLMSKLFLFDKSWFGLAILRCGVDGIVFAQIFLYSEEKCRRRAKTHIKADTEEVVPLVPLVEEDPPPKNDEAEQKAPLSTPPLSPPGSSSSDNGRRPIL